MNWRERQLFCQKSSFFMAFLFFVCSSLFGYSYKDFLKTENRDHAYPWHRNIVTTVFWIGEGRTPISAANGSMSAWDVHWTKNYGGPDDPIKRIGFLPRRFAATLNPFYVALPFNDVAYPDLARKWVPWYKIPSPENRFISQCKGKWVEIRTKSGKVAYAQWEDVGPLRSDHASYVFGPDRPHDYNQAGLDVSPAVRDYLGLSGMNLTDWRIVDDCLVPPGPWIKYGEQAIIYSAIKAREREASSRWKTVDFPMQ
ncbi:hypothetical protein [Candidatus Methylacidiphilum infernorum]|uniref:Uncharacterized protein n=1 Tax=Methylacidiphilum infernorum (isolate V4) TaxID=481448 RepID=B3DYP6_METI4|nr:hypothetical protein [Candidatus Methylacidiphilum infernorum]ACD82418.1 Conserved hypothetical protein [Methylacidiphilum infernorum V4]